MSDLERRTWAGTIELRQDGAGKELRGLGIPYNVLSGDLGGFRERIAEGAATDALARSDIAGLFNHDPSLILARQSAGTLKLKETEDGVSFRIPDLPATDIGTRVQVAVERRDVQGNSFAFVVEEDGETWEQTETGPIRTITSFREIFDIGPVTYPAYTSGTTITTRSLETVKSLEKRGRAVPMRRYAAQAKLRMRDQRP